MNDKKNYIQWIRSKVGHEKIILVFAGGYILNEKSEVLLQRRGDTNMWGFPGGAIELGETPEMAVIREVKEETGLCLTSYKMRGIVTFVSNETEGEYMFLYTADGYEGNILECDEGELEFVPKEELFNLDLWEGDKIFLDLIRNNHSFFDLKLVYEGKTLKHAILDGMEIK